jgi:AcrR family transcriptional regulator
MPRRETAAASGMLPASRLLPRRAPLQARARQRVERILQATVELLADQSAESLTTAAIAAQAEVPIGSVYHYFPSKEAILVELAGRKFQSVDGAFARRLGSELERLPWRRALELAVDEAVAAFRGHPTYVTVWRAMRSSPAFRPVAMASEEEFVRVLCALPLLSALPRPRMAVATRTAIRVGNAFLDWILDTPEPRRAAAVVREMKRALVAYLASDLDEASALSRPSERATSWKKRATSAQPRITRKKRRPETPDPSPRARRSPSGRRAGGAAATPPPP